MTYLEKRESVHPVAATILAAVLFLGCAVAKHPAYANSSETSTYGNVRIEQLVAQRSESAIGDFKVTGNDGAIKLEPVIQGGQLEGTLFPSVMSSGSGEGGINPEIIVDWAVSGSRIGTSALWSSSQVSNSVDYLVFVENKGFSSDAYFRTIIAVESLGDDESPSVVLNCDEDAYSWSAPVSNVQITMNGKTATYDIFVGVYKGLLAPGFTAPPSLLQFAVSPDAGNADIERLGDGFDIMVKTEAIEASDAMTVCSLSACGENGACGCAYRTVDDLLNDLLYQVTNEAHPWLKASVSVDVNLL